MCKGLDEQKPHLHYSAAARMLAFRMEQLTGLDSANTLRICCAIGILAMLDEMVDMCRDRDAYIDWGKHSKLLSSREMALQVVADIKREFRDWAKDPIAAMRVEQDELPF
jgi:trimethylamine:corrinoid methyltransferase-like protein